MTWITLIIPSQCDDLLGNLRCWHSCECHLKLTTHANTVVDHVHPLITTTLPDGSGPHPQQDSAPWHTVNTAQEQLEQHSKRPKVLTRPPYSQDPNLIEHLQDMLGQVWSMEAPPPDIQRIHYKTPWCLIGIYRLPTNHYHMKTLICVILWGTDKQVVLLFRSNDSSQLCFKSYTPFTIDKREEKHPLQPSRQDRMLAANHSANNTNIKTHWYDMFHDASRRGWWWGCRRQGWQTTNPVLVCIPIPVTGRPLHF